MALQWFCSAPAPERQLLIQKYGLAEMLPVWPSAQYKCWSAKHCLSLCIKKQTTKHTHTHKTYFKTKQKNPINQNWLIFPRIYIFFLQKERQPIYIFHFSKYATSCSIPLQCIVAFFVQLSQNLFHIMDKGSYFW